MHQRFDVTENLVKFLELRTITAKSVHHRGAWPVRDFDPVLLVMFWLV
jgi:hypothetical protein